MQLHHLGKSLFGKAALATAALSGLLFLAGAPSSQAADRDDDHRRVVNSERRFSDGDRGYYTREGDNRRPERREAFERPYSDYRNNDYRYGGYRNNWGHDRDDRLYHHDRDRD